MSTHDRPGAEESIDETADAGAPSTEEGTEAVDAPDGAGAECPDGAPEAAAAVEAVEAEADQLSQVTQERDDYLDALRRLQADFENYKKRMLKQQTEHLERAAERLVEKLLPVLDTADLAIQHGGGEGIEQLRTSLLDTLSKEGLDRFDPTGEAFDPNVHEAVAHEPADDTQRPEVSQVLRAGYRWKGRVLRPAMVKVRG